MNIEITQICANKNNFIKQTQKILPHYMTTPFFKAAPPFNKKPTLWSNYILKRSKTNRKNQNLTFLPKKKD
jgi:hypothetical protein